MMIRTVAAIAIAFIACKSNEPTSSRGSAAPPPPASGDPWADNGPRELPPPKVTHPFARPFIWTAKRDGKTTYLFGTLHGGVNAEHRIPLWVWRYFDAATTLIEEANLQDLEIAQWTLRPDGPTLRAELGEEYWGKLEAMVTPFVAGLLDTQATAVATLRVAGFGGGGRDAAGPMDGELLVRAQGLKKRIIFLESGQFQSALFRELYNVQALRLFIDRRDELAQLNPVFVDAYVDGDLERFTEIGYASLRLGAADDAAAERLLDRLLVARNRTWIKPIEDAHAAGGAFVAVGALHFVGANSVLDLLHARGFEIARATGPDR